MTDTAATPIGSRELVALFNQRLTAIRGEIRKLIVGQDEVVE